MKKNMLFLIFTLGFLCMGMQISASLTEMREMSLEAQKKREEQVKKEKIALIKKIGPKIALIKKIGPLEALKEQLKAAANQFNTIATRTLRAANSLFYSPAYVYITKARNTSKGKVNLGSDCDDFADRGCKNIIDYPSCFDNDNKNDIEHLRKQISNTIKRVRELKEYFNKNGDESEETLKAKLGEAINNLREIADKNMSFPIDSIFREFDECKGKNIKKPKQFKDTLKRVKSSLLKTRIFARKKVRNHEIFLKTLEEVESKKGE